MADKVKPLKIENSGTGGTENDAFPVETDPTEDYLAAKGVAFENSDSYLIDKSAGNELQWKDGVQTVAKTFNSLNVAAASARTSLIYARKGNTSNKFLELFSGIPCDKAPYDVPEACTLKTVVLRDGSDTNATCTATIYNNGVSVMTISLSTSKRAKSTGLTHAFAIDDKVTVKITSGSVTDPIMFLQFNVG